MCGVFHGRPVRNSASCDNACLAVHGIGRKPHEEPFVPHFGRAGTGMQIRPGMVFTIEPMINAGSSGVRIKDDGWTAFTSDGSLSAQFEHMLAVREDRVEILTLP